MKYIIALFTLFQMITGQDYVNLFKKDFHPNFFQDKQNLDFFKSEISELTKLNPLLIADLILTVNARYEFNNSYKEVYFSKKERQKKIRNNWAINFIQQFDQSEILVIRQSKSLLKAFMNSEFIQELSTGEIKSSRIGNYFLYKYYTRNKQLKYNKSINYDSLRSMVEPKFMLDLDHRFHNTTHASYLVNNYLVFLSDSYPTGIKSKSQLSLKSLLLKSYSKKNTKYFYENISYTDSWNFYISLVKQNKSLRIKQKISNKLIRSSNYKEFVNYLLIDQKLENNYLIQFHAEKRITNLHSIKFIDIFSNIRFGLGKQVFNSKEYIEHNSNNYEELTKKEKLLHSKFSFYEFNIGLKLPLYIGKANSKVMFQVYSNTNLHNFSVENSGNHSFLYSNISISMFLNHRLIYNLYGDIGADYYHSFGGDLDNQFAPFFSISYKIY